MIRASKIIGYILKNSDLVTRHVNSSDIYFVRIPQSNTSSVKIRYSIKGSNYATPKQGQATVDTFWVDIDIYASNPIDGSETARAIRRLLDKHEPGEINGELLDGLSIEDEETLPDLLFDRDVVRYSLEFKIRVINKTDMNYSLTEQDTGDTWIDGTSIFERTFDHSTNTGSVEMPALLKAWHVFTTETSFWDGTNSKEELTINIPTATGTTGWVIVIDNDSTQAYTTARYMKQSIEP